MFRISEFLKRAREKPEQDAKETYKPIPMTLALSKRKWEEEQFAKYEVTKEKKSSMK